VQRGVQTTHGKQYYWGVNDQLRQLSDTLHDTHISFGHDPFGNLAWADYGTEKQLRLPDEVGNLFKTKERKDRKYGDAGQLLESGKVKYYYDEEGNLIRKIVDKGVLWDYEWYDNGHLKKVIRPDKKVVTFTYDALGRRTSKTFEGKTTRWIWDGNVPLHEWVEDQHEEPRVNDKGEVMPREIDSAALTTWLFEEAGSFVPMAKLKGDKQYSIITDHLGTSVQMYNITGEKTWECELDSYGKIRMLEGHATSCPFRYQGQYEDIETGLYYNRFRYYNPEDGVYVSQDPIRLEGGLNFYSYVLDNLVLVDPFGLMPLMSGATQKGMLRSSFEYLKRYGPSAMRKHHLIPQEMFKDTSFMNRLDLITKGKGKDFIHKQIATITNELHNTIHDAGWNPEFKKWAKNNPKFSLKDLQQQVKKMMKSHQIPKSSRNFSKSYCKP